MERFEIGTRVRRNGSTGKVVRHFKTKHNFQGVVVRWDNATYDEACVIPVEGPCEFEALPQWPSP
jgi:hypothetical protein